MLLMGDEVRRTQLGNNNAYGHDDPLSWFDWTAVDRQADLLRFTRGLIRIRREVATVIDLPDDASLLDILADASLEWSGVNVGAPDLGPDSHSVALTLRVDEGALQLIFNAYWEALDFELPEPDVECDGWRRIVDTSLPSPDDVALERAEAAPVVATSYRAEARSIVVLATRRSAGSEPGRRAR
jgi:glycogen operon protein